jgi:RHS repeat-associated protein
MNNTRAKVAKIVKAFVASLTAASRRTLAFCMIMVCASLNVLAQNSSANGVPAESKTGQSAPSTYARDKIETVNLANGNFSLAIPLAAVGGRGAPSFPITLSYNSKVWTTQADRDDVETGGGEAGTPVTRYSALYDKAIDFDPGLMRLGGGWTILTAPAIKAKVIGVDYVLPGCSARSEDGPVCGYKYALTKMWLSLPDGSQVELRDNATDGAPMPTTDIRDGYHVLSDIDRGRVWHSFDGTYVTFVRDTAPLNTFSQDTVLLPSGWVFLADGTRLRMDAGYCSTITDSDGNYVTIGAGPNGSIAYTDELGRQTYLQAVNGVVTVTTPSYSVSVNTGVIGALNSSGVADNLRADYRDLPRPFTAGDYYTDPQSGDIPHTIVGPHTDLFGTAHSETERLGEFGHAHVDEQTAVTQLNLPDGRTFRFRYNPWGEVAEIVYPGGGVSQVDYDGPTQVSSCPSEVTVLFGLDRGVGHRRALTDGMHTDATWVYSGDGWSADGQIYPGVKVEAHRGNSDGGELLSSERHIFKALAAEYQICGPTWTGTGDEMWTNAKEFRTETTTGAGTVVTTRDWEQNTPVAWPTGNAYASEHGVETLATNNPHVMSEETMLEDGKTKRVEYTYDQFNNVTSINEYDFFQQGQTPTLLRQTVRTYVGDGATPSLHGYCYTNLNPHDESCGTGLATDVTSIIHQKHLLLSEEVLDGAGHREAYSDHSYDEYTAPFVWSNDHTNQSLVTNSNMTMYDGSHLTSFVTSDPSHQPRGSVTSIRSWIEGDDSNNTSIYATSYNRYDNAGHVIGVRDPLNNESFVSYTDDYGDGTSPGAEHDGPNGATFAFPTSAMNALGQVAYTQYDYALGKATGGKDANGVIAKTEYDNIGRPVRTTAALGLAEQSVAEATYPTATSNVSTASKQLDSMKWLASKTEMDGFDRPVLSALAEDGQKADSASFTVFTTTIYDALGRVKFVTNPYRSQAASTDGWTRTTYDVSGRVTRLATFAGGPSAPPSDDTACTSIEGCTGMLINTYASEQTTVVDQANKQRRSTVDGLGRLISVDEMNEYPSTSIYATTTYTYDARGNLKTVNQGQQTRTFTYDGMSRLKSATNPEVCQQGQAQCVPVPVTYTYDVNGNLHQKTNARGITITYQYDAINRLISRTYSDNSTPQVNYFYDSQAIPDGAPAFERGKSLDRLVAVTYGGSTLGSYIGQYDAMGRPKLSYQVTDTEGGSGVATYSMAYSYDLAGNLISETYPSGRIITTEYDQVGRVAGVKNQATGLYYAGDASNNSANRIQYTTSGAVSAVKLGNGLWEHTSFNSRLQPTQIGLGTSSSISGTFQLDYNYGTTDNNGNIRTQTITVPGMTGPYIQTYSYDELNRLTTAEETNNQISTTLPTWKQVYSYDRYGNRSLITGTTYPTQLNTITNPQVEPATNRIVSAGYGYDADGNLMCDPGHPCTQTPFIPYFTYDAENRQKSANGSFNDGGTSYTYDGDGRRVKKATSNGEITVFVYDVAGKTIAEYSNQVEYNGTQYLTTDTLGSTRVVTDKDGDLKSRHDYVPFGEELPGDMGGRTVARGYTGESVRRMFTGYERDEESGLDYAESRYYSSIAGRYTSIDPLPIQQRPLLDPQNLNSYTYVTNNPLKYIDPNALEKIIVIIRTYIPTETVSVAGYTYNGNVDSSGKRKEGEEGYKTEQRIEFESDPSDDRITFTDRCCVGVTHEYDSNGNVKESGHASGSTLHIGASRNDDGGMTIDAQGDEGNPLAPLHWIAPRITFDFKVTIQSDGANGDVRVSVSGQHDGYPAYEIIVQRPESGNTSTTVYSYNPNDTGKGPWSLWGSGDIYPNDVKTTIPSGVPPPPQVSAPPPSRRSQPRRRRHQRRHHHRPAA